MTDTPNSAPNSPSARPKLPKNFNVLTFTAACPSCGAPVEFASAGSVMAVCEYCQTTVLKEGEALTEQGKQSLTIEDYSPLQVGSVGRYDGDDFAIIGRIQLRYSQGIWNEWYLQFATGQTGWLTEALGQYSITIGVPKSVDLPSYDSLGIEDTVNYAGMVYRVTDRREATVIAGEGELPYVVDKGWQTWGIDARSGRRFITLDYASPTGKPLVYDGEAVNLDALHMQLLKDDGNIKATAAGIGSSEVDKDSSQASFSVDKLDCPNCGSPIPFVAGKTDFVICPSCHSESKLTGDKAEVIKMHSAMQQYRSTLSLGAKARIDTATLTKVAAFSQSDVSQLDTRASPQDALTAQSTSQTGSTVNKTYHDFIIIGIMHLSEVGESGLWTEYLLYSLTDGFLWLSDEADGWHMARVLNELPDVRGNELFYDNRRWRQIYDSYQSKVNFAVGAFNWQVKIGDHNTLVDYGNGDETITTEQTSKEITYTHAIPVTGNQLNQWFGDDFNPTDAYDGQGQATGALKSLLTSNLLAHLFVIFIMSGSFIILIISSILIFLVFMIKSNREEGETPFEHDSTSAKVMAIIIIAIGLLLSAMIGMLSPQPVSNNNNTGGGFIFIPDGRTGYSSGGSHK